MSSTNRYQNSVLTFEHCRVEFHNEKIIQCYWEEVPNKMPICIFIYFDDQKNFSCFGWRKLRQWRQCLCHKPNHRVLWTCLRWRVGNWRSKNGSKTVVSCSNTMFPTIVVKETNDMLNFQFIAKTSQSKFDSKKTWICRCH